MRNQTQRAQLGRLYHTLSMAGSVWLLTAALFYAGDVQAQTIRTWTGGGTDANWNTPANWDSGAPVNNDTLVFLGPAGLANTNNISNLLVRGIGFNGSGFNLTGNSLTNIAGVYDNAGANTNAFAMNLGAAQSFTNASGGPLVFTGNVTNNDFNLQIAGDGTVMLNGILGGGTLGGGLTYDGGAGTLRLAGANTFIGGLTINGGTIQLANGAAIPSGSGRGDVTVALSGKLDLNANSQTINGLYGQGNVDNSSGTGTYTLTLGNNSTNSAGTFDGTISQSSGTIALNKVNTNKLTLNGNAYHSGVTTIAAGTLAVGPNAYIGSTARINVTPGALLDISATTLNLNLGQTLTAGRATNDGPADINGTLSLGSGNLTIYRSGAPGTLTVNGGLGLSLVGGTVTFDLGNTSTMGSGSNDLIAINGTLNLGSATVLFNPLAGSFAATPYLLISNATASVSGSASSLQTSLPRGLSVTFDGASKPGSLYATFSGAANPATLTWNGNSGDNWDVKISQTWLNGASPDYFYNLDNVIFNDVAPGFSVYLPGPTVSPTTAVFNNVVSNYVLNGPGAISGPGTLTLNGGGTVTLNTPNNYAGDTIINNGSTLISGVLAASPHITVYNGLSTFGNLRLGGGGFYLWDDVNDTYRANFNNLIVDPGAGSVSMRSSRQSSSTPWIQFNSVFRSGAGGTVDFNNIQNKASSPQCGLFITNTATVNGILGGFATIYESDWVVPVVTGAGTVAYADYQTSTTPTDWLSTSNVSLAANPSANLNNTVINSLRFSAASAVTINAGQTLTLSSGGLLVSAGTTGPASISGGTLLGEAGTDLVVHQHSQLNSFTIGSVIANNGAPSALTKSGQGTLILTGNNTYTGPTYINGPSINSFNNNTPGKFPAGTLQIGNGGTSGGISSSSGVINNAILAFNRSDAITFGLPISGNGGIKVFSGNVTLSGNNTFAGPSTIFGGSTLQVGNGGTVGSLGSSSSIANAGALIFNRSDSIACAAVITGEGSLTQQGAGTLTLSGASTYSGNTLVPSGKLVLGAGGSLSNSALLLVGTGATLDASAAGGLVLNGAVGQVLAGSGTVRGDVTTSVGAGLSPATGGVIGTLALNNNLTLDGGTFDFDLSTASRDQITVAGNLALNAGLMQVHVLGSALPNGTYRLISCSGTVSGSANNLTVAGFFQPGQIATLSAGTGGLDLVISSYTSLNLVWSGNGVNNNWDINSTADWLNGGVASVFHNYDNATFDDGGSSTPAVNLIGTISPALVTVNAVKDYTFGGAGLIDGSANLVKNNSGNLILLTTNSYTGTTTISGGTVQVGDGVTSGDIGTGDVTDNAALVFNQPDNRTVSANIGGNGTLTQQGSGTLTLSGNNTFSGTIAINAGVLQVGVGGPDGTLGNGPVTDSTTLLFNRSGNLTANNVIGGTGQVIFNGPGTVTLGGANSYVGNTYISNGVVKLGASEVIPNGAPSTGWLILDGSATIAGTFDLNGYNETVNALSGLGGTVRGVIMNNAPSTVSTLTVSNDVSTVYWGNIINNSGSGGQVALGKNGTGTLTLQPQSANLYSGGTFITNGTVELQTGTSGSTLTFPQINDTGLGTGPVTFYGGTLQLDGWSGSTSPTYGTFPNNIVVPAGQVGCIRLPCRTASAGVSGTVSGGGTLYLSARYVRSYAAANFSGFTGTIIVTNNAAGATDPVLGLGNAAGMPSAKLSIGTFGAGGNVTVFNRVSGNPLVPIGELSGDSTAIMNNPGSGPGGQNCRWLVGGLNTSSEYAGATANGIGFVKQGTGRFTLSGNAAHTGITTVSNGVLALSGSATLASSSTITIAAPGQLDVSGIGGLYTLGASAVQTLAGNGTLLGNLTVAANGRVAPGFSIGTLTVTGSASLGGTNIMEIDATNSPTSDRLVANSIVYGGVLNVTAIHTPVSSATFKLFSSTAPLSGSFTATNLPPLPAGMAWDTSKLGVDGTISVSGTPIPPVVGPVQVVGTTNIIRGTGGGASATFQMLSSTNVALPLASWTVLGTGTFAADGSYSFTNTAATNAVQFYTVREVLP